MRTLGHLCRVAERVEAHGCSKETEIAVNVVDGSFFLGKFLEPRLTLQRYKHRAPLVDGRIVLDFEGHFCRTLSAVRKQHHFPSLVWVVGVVWIQ